MTSRERVLASIAHREPDRVPFNLRPAPEMVKRLRQIQNNPQADLPQHFGHDVRYVQIPLAGRPDNVPEQDWTPQPETEAIERCRTQTASLQETGLAVCSAYACGVFEQAKDWFGDVEVLTLPIDDPARLGTELERITEWKMAVYGAYAKAGVDIVWIGDDLGMQQSLIMSPEQYRQWYRPCHERIVRHLHELRSDVLIAFHCCGFVTTLIPDLIEVGIDILEAVQPECMDLSQLKSEFGRDISFWGGIGAQSVLARSSRNEILEGVRKTLEIMGPGGGYIVAPCHTLTEEVPWESVIAFHDAVAKYGAYPSPGRK